jgi:4-carboxymuconolactone decarboxylase
VNGSVGSFAPDLARYTNELLFNDLWRRTDLSPRDRSLVTIVVLAVGGHVDQMPFHLQRGRNNGLTRAEMQEVLLQLAFYAGWPRAFTALPVVQKVFVPEAE